MNVFSFWSFIFILLFLFYWNQPPPWPGHETVPHLGATGTQSLSVKTWWGLRDFRWRRNCRFESSENCFKRNAYNKTTVKLRPLSPCPRNPPVCAKSASSCPAHSFSCCHVLKVDVKSLIYALGGFTPRSSFRDFLDYCSPPYPKSHLLIRQEPQRGEALAWAHAQSTVQTRGTTVGSQPTRLVAEGLFPSSFDSHRRQKSKQMRKNSSLKILWVFLSYDCLFRTLRQAGVLIKQLIPRHLCKVIK